MRHDALAFVAACGAALGIHFAADGLSWQQTSGSALVTRARSELTITVPHDQAELFVDGQQIEGAGTTRRFETPPLEADRTFRYELTVKWRPNGYTRMTRVKTVEFQPGAVVPVDLTAEDPGDRVEVLYVPTPDPVVDQMIALATVTGEDVVYEPGCGDARVLIAAVRAGAKRGVGIDLDPERVAESRRNVSAAGLADRIEIRLGDALDIRDLSQASVVFLYMGDDFNRLIRPILWRQLAVGARVVSHRFTMGDWAPDRTEIARDESEVDYQVHLWRITETVKAKADGLRQRVF